MSKFFLFLNGLKNIFATIESKSKRYYLKVIHKIYLLPIQKTSQNKKRRFQQDRVSRYTLVIY